MVDEAACGLGARAIGGSEGERGGDGRSLPWLDRGAASVGPWSVMSTVGMPAEEVLVAGRSLPYLEAVGGTLESDGDEGPRDRRRGAPRQL